MTTRVALLDVDGTLIDANYQHALGWYRAFRALAIVVPIWRIHRHIGMGGDLLVAAVSGDEIEERFGDALRERQHDEFLRLRDECEPLAGARELLAELRGRGARTVLASSAGEDDMRHFLARLGGEDVVDAWTSAAHVDRSKPYPNVVLAALDRVGGAERAMMVGDSRWDVEAATRGGLPTVCVLTGGWSAQELQEAGAVRVFESLPELCARLDETPLFS